MKIVEKARIGEIRSLYCTGRGTNTLSENCITKIPTGQYTLKNVLENL